MGSKGTDKVVSDKFNIKSSKYVKTNLRSKRKRKGNLTGGKTLLSRAAKQGLPVLGQENKNYETHCCFGSEKNALLPVVLVNIKSVHQLQSRRKRKINLVGVKPVIRKQMREVQNLGVPDLESLNDRIYKGRWRVGTLFACRRYA